MRSLQILLVRLDHLLERVTRTAFGITNRRKRRNRLRHNGLRRCLTPQVLQVLFAALTGENLDVQAEGTVLLRCNKYLVNIASYELLGDDALGGVLLGVVQDGADGVKLLSHVSGGLLLGGQLVQLSLQCLGFRGALLVHGEEVRVVQLALSIEGSYASAPR